MNQINLKQFFDTNAPENVEGPERAASAAIGVILLGRGLRRGGLSGVLQMAMGGMALARGVTGHCEIKRILQEKQGEQSQSNADERYSHMPLDSEVHSPDFKDSKTAMPDSTPMGHETHTKPGGGV